MSGSVPAYFGAWLQHRRREAGIGHEDLADRLGCSVSTLHKIETGVRRPSRQIALLIADLFGLPADERESFITFARAANRAHPPPPHTSPSLPGAPGAVPTPHASHAPWRVAHLRQSNLPLALTSFIAREPEEKAIRDLLAQRNVHLLTLVGAPGIGKTRLGMEIAARPDVSEQFEDGVVMVELASIIDPALVLPSIAKSLGLREAAGQGLPLEALLLQYVQDKRILLLLDNFEQLLDAAPGVVELLARSPWLKIMVTSREPLHVRGERRFQVPRLNYLPSMACST